MEVLIKPILSGTLVRAAILLFDHYYAGYFQLLQSQVLTTLRKKDFDWKGENICKEHFLLFSQCFLPIQGLIPSFNSLPHRSRF